MPSIILLSENEELKEVFNEFKPVVLNAAPKEDFFADFVILDSAIENSKLVFADICAKNVNMEFEIIALVEPFEFDEYSNCRAAVVLKPVNKGAVINLINVLYERKTALSALQNENLELKKNLYQINAFYNASSKFAGTLDKTKLYEVMFETFERILSYDLAAAFFKDNFEQDKLKFYVYSLKKVPETLKNNLMGRLSLTGKNEGMHGLSLSKNSVEIIQNAKHSYKSEYYDTDVVNYDSLYAPILIKDKFEGVIEIFRKNPFTKEDAVCFQSIVHQVLAPLRSAILYEDIINANIKLKKLERIKSEFVSIVSHELRTPLTPINNALSIILSEKAAPIGEVNKNFANIAKRNVTRLSGIIEDLLDLSRMQTGKFDFKFKKTEIYSSIELVYNTFKNQTAAKNIEFEISLQENIQDVYIDRKRIEQILSNLVTNAIKFTPEGGKISISLSQTKDINKNLFISPSLDEYNGAYVKISIKDTGIGIEQGDIPKIFDKFSQIENSLSRNTGGIGLGLTISKYFIDVHSGAIWVNSKKNEGTEFNVIIPVYDEERAFETDLNLKIKNENKIGYFKIFDKNNTGFYDYLKNSNIIKLTQYSGEISYNKDGGQISRVYIPNLDKNAYDFMVSKIEDEIKLKNSCDIVLSRAYYKRENG